MKPYCPRFLSGDARREWHRVISFLVAQDLYCELHRTLLAGYCQIYSNWLDAVRSLHENGLTYRTAAGRARCRPEQKIAREAHRMMGEFCDTFYQLTDPVGRMLIPGSPPAEFADFQRFLAARFRSERQAQYKIS